MGMYVLGIVVKGRRLTFGFSHPGVVDTMYALHFAGARRWGRFAIVPGNIRDMDVRQVSLRTLDAPTRG